nr:immunoglobulin light chain junction region [Macaca mulatta]MOY03273.1 immunoglobulin light chain junction region [Macaca mulatta]MOY03275.1 immunoglobulin light chain junction region [Macaca mulatta]
CQQYAIYPLTF